MSPGVFLALVAAACVRVYFVSSPAWGTAGTQEGGIGMEENVSQDIRGCFVETL